MTLSNYVPEFLDYINKSANHIHFNRCMFDIYEGELYKFILEDLKNELSKQSFDQLQHRIVPINILRKVIDKLSTIYQQMPIRKVIDGTDQDKELLDWYEKECRFNFKLNVADEFFNLFNSNLIQPYVYEGTPRLRVIPNDRYLVFSDNEIEPNVPTHIILLYGTRKKDTGDVYIYHAYSKDEFIIFNSDNEIEYGIMQEHQNVDGTNPYGVLPFVYTNRSNNLLIPKNDVDGFKITKLLPVLLTDLSGAIKFQAWSIIYGIDVNQENLTMSANAFWNLKSDPNSDKQPQLGTIKPEIDIDSVLSYVQAMISLWLNTKGIRAGTIGSANEESQLSGISKLIDEMDTVEQRKKSVSYFTHTESELWDLILHKMHPVWVGQGLINTNYLFTPTAYIETTFEEQIPNIKRSELVDSLEKEVNARFMPRFEAIRKLNPQFSDEEIINYMKRIDEENTIMIEDDLENNELVDKEKEDDNDNNNDDMESI